MEFGAETKATDRYIVCHVPLYVTCLVSNRLSEVQHRRRIALYGSLSVEIGHSSLADHA